MQNALVFGCRLQRFSRFSIGLKKGDTETKTQHKVDKISNQLELVQLLFESFILRR